MQNKTFAIVSDIDGVIRMGGNYNIGGASESIQNIQEQNIPLYLLTNAGSITEKRETEIINAKLNSNF